MPRVTIGPCDILALLIRYLHIHIVLIETVWGTYSKHTNCKLLYTVIPHDIWPEANMSAASICMEAFSLALFLSRSYFHSHAMPCTVHSLSISAFVWKNASGQGIDVRLWGVDPQIEWIPWSLLVAVYDHVTSSFAIRGDIWGFGRVMH